MGRALRTVARMGRRGSAGVNSEPRYIDWNYDTHEAVEYKRTGECNMCGECCMARISFDVDWKRENARDGGMGVPDDEKNGIWTEWTDGVSRHFWRFHSVDPSIYSPCPMLRYDSHKCLLHEGGKRLIHWGWPFSPQNVTPFRRCSYQFEEISRWEFDDAS